MNASVCEVDVETLRKLREVTLERPRRPGEKELGLIPLILPTGFDEA